jgi:sigma-B regulation protein RsbU (phosphoserine phosphatase)
MTPNQRALAASVGAAACGYIVAATLEATVIHWVRPTEWELAWVSDAALAVALGVVVYLWRHLVTTRSELQERDRAELVLQTQLSVAAEIQQRLLPRVPPDSGFEWAALLKSAGKIGGDFYDFVEIAPRVWVMLLADVSGKGIPAAMALGSLQSAFRALARESSNPARIVSQLSAVLYEEWTGALYVTCIVGLFESNERTLTYTNAGHPAGIVAGRGGIRYLTRGGPPAGLFPSMQFDQEVVQLHTGDACLFVTDGITEALDGDMSLERNLEGASGCENRTSAASVCQTVMARAVAGHGPSGAGQWSDDRTVVVVKVWGSVVDRPDAEAVAKEVRSERALSVNLTR